MHLREIAQALALQPRSGAGELDREVSSAYCSDLMSDVLAHAEENALWITMQTHVNIVAVAVTRDLAAVVLSGGHEPETETLARAAAEEVPVLVSDLPTFELAGRLYALGLRATAERRGGA